jgi:hypothetical protein
MNDISLPEADANGASGNFSLLMALRSPDAINQSQQIERR